ncbi:methyl-accepting chemotaxis protein, partial [Photobacterium sp. OFAV2-7]|nr:methyl-accepting chemotaxis protein [Photobacterium sp. OFAV2-7]
MTSKLSFKVKILSTLILVLIATVTTSYISINYYVSSYIFESDENSISAQINLVKEKLEDDIASKIFLAENIKIGLTGLDDVKQRTDFYAITKVLSDLVVNHQGRVEDETLANKYIDQVEQSYGVTLSDVFYQDDIPLVSITIPRGNASGDIFYIDLRNVQSLLSQSTVRGSYIELRDPKHNLVFSNKVKGDLIALESPLSIGNKQWQLTGYIDKGFISERTNSLNTRITLALLMVSLITIPGSIFILNKILSNLSSLRNIIVALSRGDADLTRRL